MKTEINEVELIGHFLKLFELKVKDLESSASKEIQWRFEYTSKEKETYQYTLQCLTDAIRKRGYKVRGFDEKGRHARVLIITNKDNETKSFLEEVKEEYNSFKKGTQNIDDVIESIRSSILSSARLGKTVYEHMVYASSKSVKEFDETVKRILTTFRNQGLTVKLGNVHFQNSQIWLMITFSGWDN